MPAPIPDSSVSYWVIIPAAGSGKRYQSETPKQYLELAGRSVLEHSVSLFLEDPLNLGVIIAVEPGNPYFDRTGLENHPKVYVVEGGQQRCHSVLNALWFLQSLEASGDASRVLVHDAARPCLTRDELSRLLAARVDSHSAAILAAPVTDTLKRSGMESPLVAETVDRTLYWLAQTPQMAQLASLLHAIEHALDNAREPTDEAAAMEFCGMQVELVASSRYNIKVTEPGDLELANCILASRSGHDCADKQEKPA